MKHPELCFLEENYPLSAHTFYHIGGNARWALFPRSISEMTEAFDWIQQHNLPFIVLGAGTNVLVHDSGYQGAVLFTTRMQYIEHTGQNCYCVGAGVSLGELVTKVMLPNNYSGIGALTGIPGTIGGALFMNAGTVNGSICQFTESVRLLSSEGITSHNLSPLSYSYRGQSFCPPGVIILEGTFVFSCSSSNEQDVYYHYLERRRNTQPQGWCCGSVFKNPEGNHAGKLIELCGLKGKRLGGAVISEKHANFIINENNASFDDVYGLICLAKNTVKDKYGIDLVEEVRIISS